MRILGERSPIPTRLRPLPLELIPLARSQLVVEILTAFYDEAKAGNMVCLTAPASSPASVTAGTWAWPTPTPWAAS